MPETKEIAVKDYPDRASLDADALAKEGIEDVIFVGTFEELRSKGLSESTTVHGFRCKMLADPEPPPKEKKIKKKKKVN